MPTSDDYKRIAEKFTSRWKMPNCVGALDGKHFDIVKPPNSHALYYNYKAYTSVVLMATCDAEYKFTHINLGACGSQSDGGILRNSSFGHRLLNSTLPIPPPTNLPESNILFPHFFIGDAAFPLHENIMRPYPGNLTPQQDAFNNRLSSARMTIECTFGE